MNKRQLTINIILLIILVVVAICIQVVSAHKQNQTIETVDKDTGNVVVSRNTSHDESVIPQSGYKPTVLSSNKIFDLGLTVDEYQAMQGLINIYTKATYGSKKYLVYTINSDSVTYTKSTKTFSFKMSIKDTKTVLDTTLQRSGSNLKLILSHDGSVVFNKSVEMSK